MTVQVPSPAASPPPRPRTIRQVSTPFLMLNLAVLAMLCLVMIAWLRPLLIERGLVETASTLFALAAGALLFVVLSRGTKAMLQKDHRMGMRHARAGRYDEAIVRFEKSYDFFTRSRWVDDLRWWVCLDSSAISYREMALFNIGFCRLAMGDAAGAQAAYARLLAEFPASRLKDEIAKDITEIEGRKPAT